MIFFVLIIVSIYNQMYCLKADKALGSGNKYSKVETTPKSKYFIPQIHIPQFPANE